MWQKVDPRGFRIGLMKSWLSEWFATEKKLSATYTIEDLKIRHFIEKFYPNCWVAKIIFRKWAEKNELFIFTAKPALILGKEWKKLEEFKLALKKKFGYDYTIQVKGINKPELSAKVMAEFICMQLEKRMPYRRVAKNALKKIMQKWAVWAKVLIWGRLNWAEIARKETFIEWRVPLQTLRADIDYHYTTALTKYWVLWVKVWIYRGDFENDRRKKKNKKFTTKKNFRNLKKN